MAGSSSPRPDDNDCLRLPATSSPRTRGAEKKESTGLRLSQPCPPCVTPSSISSFGRRLNGVHTAENKSLKNTGANRFCQSSARRCTHKPAAKSASLRYRPPLRNRGKCRDGPKAEEFSWTKVRLLWPASSRKRQPY